VVLSRSFRVAKQLGSRTPSSAGGYYPISLQKVSAFIGLAGEVVCKFLFKFNLAVDCSQQRA